MTSFSSNWNGIKILHKATDVDSGKFMAVKILEQPSRKSKQEDWRILKTLSNISHVSKIFNPYTHELISVLATHRRLYRVTRLGRTEGGDTYGPERRHLGIIGREWSRCYGYWMQESFVRGPIGLRLLRRFSGRFCLQPLTWIRF